MRLTDLSAFRVRIVGKWAAVHSKTQRRCRALTKKRNGCFSTHTKPSNGTLLWPKQVGQENQGQPKLVSYFKTNTPSGERCA